MIPGSKSRSLGALMVAAVMFCAMTLSAGAARAAEAYTITNVSMRAGPSTAYPRILVVNAGTPVTVYGCLQDYSWCDTSFEDNRGWVAGSYLDYPYQGNRVAIPSLGAQLGLAILNFSLDDYWGNYYRNRPFYGRRSYWDRHPPRPVFVRPPHRPRPPPAVKPPRPPRPQPPTVRPPRPKPPGPGPGTRPPRPGQGNGGRPPGPGQGSGGGGKPPGPGPGAGKPPPGQGGGNRPGPGNRPQRPDKPNPPPRPSTKPAPATPNAQ